MVKSDLKKSIDANIGKDHWMTASLAKKMAKPIQKRKSKRFIWVPFTVTIAACALIIVLINMNHIAIKNSTLQDSNILNYVDDASMGEAIIDYLKSIESKDEKKIVEQAQGMYENKDAKDLITKYEHAQFNSIQVLHLAKSNFPYLDIHYAYLMVNVDNEETTYLHTLTIEKQTDGWFISESANEEKMVYEPFVMPSYLGFHYEPVASFDKDDLYAFRDLALHFPSIQLAENMTAHFYEENGYAMLVIQKGESYYPIIDLHAFEQEGAEPTYSFSMIENANDLDYYVLSSGDNMFLTLFYNESIDKFQAYLVEDGSEMYFKDVDGNGISELLINSDIPFIGTVEVGQFVISNSSQNFDSHINESFVDVKFYQDMIAIKYEDANGESYANYKWKTVNEAQFVNNEKIDHLFE